MLLEDHERWLRVNEIKKILFIDKKLAYYRVLPTGITATKHDKMVVEDMYLKLKYDQWGINRMRAYHFILSKLKKKEKIPDLVLNEYYKYPFRVKSLVFALKTNINPRISTLLLKFNKNNVINFFKSKMN